MRLFPNIDHKWSYDYKARDEDTILEKKYTVIITLKMPSKFIADDILIFLNYFLEQIRLDIWCKVSSL